MQLCGSCLNLLAWSTAVHSDDLKGAQPFAGDIMVLPLLAAFFLGMGFASFTVLDYHLHKMAKCDKVRKECSRERKVDE